MNLAGLQTKRTAWVAALAAVLVWTSTSVLANNSTATIAPLGDQVRGPAAYQPAQLTIDRRNSASSTTSRGVLVTSTSGGPAILCGIVIPPRSIQTIRVELPSFSVAQEYKITLVADETHDAAPVEELLTKTDWPAHQVSTDRMIRPDLYEKHEPSMPRWPKRLLDNLILTSILTVLALLGILFIPAGWKRPAAAITIIAASISISVALLMNQPVIEVTELENGKLLMVKTLRSATWEYPGPDRLIPLYYARDELTRESLVHLPDGVSRVQLKPDSVRLFSVKPVQSSDASNH